MSWVDKLTRHEEPERHIAWKDIEEHAPKKEFADFCSFMRGQTMLVRDDGDGGVYTWDFDRWVRQGRKTEQGLDWD
jgi:hypothetical protein